MASGGKESVCIIIPTWNKCDLLRACLRSLAQQTVVPSVLVVDNGSTDGTRAMVEHEFGSFRYLTLSSNLGFARAVNRGIQATDVAIIGLLNNDTEADPRFVESALDAFASHPDCSIIACKLVNFWQRDRLDSAGDCYSRTGMPYKRGAGQLCETFSTSEQVLSASGGAAFYRRAVFESIGLLDESYYMYLEDVDLCLRAQVAGFRCLYVPGSVVYHMEAASDPDCLSSDQLNTTGSRHGYYSKSRVYWITRNRWLLMIAYQPLRNAHWLLYGWTHSFLYHLLKAGYFGAFLRGLLAGIAATRLSIAKRRTLRKQPGSSFEHLWQLIGKC